MIQKILGVAAVCGLAVSLSAIAPRPTQATPQAGRALSSTEMQKTTGAGYICDARTCNDSDGCDLLENNYYAHYPKTVCRYVPYPVDCNNNATGICYTAQAYDPGWCPMSEHKKGGVVTVPIDYCSLF